MLGERLRGGHGADPTLPNQTPRMPAGRRRVGEKRESIKKKRKGEEALPANSPELLRCLTPPPHPLPLFFSPPSLSLAPSSPCNTDRGGDGRKEPHHRFFGGWEVCVCMCVCGGRFLGAWLGEASVCVCLWAKDSPGTSAVDFAGGGAGVGCSTCHSTRRTGTPLGRVPRAEPFVICPPACPPPSAPGAGVLSSSDTCCIGPPPSNRKPWMVGGAGGTLRAE